MMIESAADPREVGMSASRLTNVSNWAKEWVDSGKVLSLSLSLSLSLVPFLTNGMTLI